MPFGLPTPADRALARENARGVAVALESKVTSHRKIVLGSPDSPFKVPFHSVDFWFTVLVSDCTYTLRGAHKRGQVIRDPEARFEVSVKHPWQNLATTQRQDRLSRGLGCDVFAAEWQPQEAAVRHLLRPAVLDIFCRIDLCPVHLFFLCPAQILVEAEFISAEQCAAQVRVYRDLLLCIAPTQSGAA